MGKSEKNVTIEPGIVKLPSGKYKVTLDYGRDEVTGKQKKTHKTVDTLKEARALKGSNAKDKGINKNTGVTGKVPFSKAVAYYNAFYESGWSASYTVNKHNQEKRMLAYFGDKDVKTINTLDIEKFFQYCRQPNEQFPHGLSNNTIQKYKTHLSGIWKFMLKAKNVYGVTENQVSEAEVGEIHDYQVQTFTAEQLSTLLSYITHCEKDHSTFAMVGLCGLAGFRRGELCGLQWRDIDWDNKIIDIQRQRAQIGSKVLVKVPKMGKDDGQTREERKQRYVALPDTLAYLLKAVKQQQEEFMEQEVQPEDFVYRTKLNIARGELPRPSKIDKRFRELVERCNKVQANKELAPLPVIRLHDLRHSYISICLNGDVNPLTVSANCGHNTKVNYLSTSTKRYWHDDGDRTEIVDFIDSTFKDTNMTILDLSE